MTELTRRRLLQAGLAVPAYLLLGCGGDEAGSGDTGSSRTAAPTRACGHVTEPQTEGPFWTPSSPQRQSLVERRMPGIRLILVGMVMDTRCRPIEAAVLDFWQADDGGAYDNQGFTLRGHQRSAADGSYRLETIVPGLYPGRTRHIHVKVQRPAGDVLTTQLYFPDAERNGDDGIFDEDLVVRRWRERSGARHARFDFVLA
ncbi:MAG: intradiol ring-cleavage dioxygenase [Actinomycetota bacterium]|nr:intradiol ring-cleavage dioxygenase [Actinomycetota bacterium]